MATEGMDTNEVDELSGWAEALEEQKKSDEKPAGDVQGGPLSGDGAGFSDGTGTSAPLNDINMVLELDALAGEPMDVLVNGYLIAQGEVVVVNEKFGIRLTDVVTPSERLKRVSRG